MTMKLSQRHGYETNAPGLKPELKGHLAAVGLGKLAKDPGVILDAMGKARDNGRAYPLDAQKSGVAPMAQGQTPIGASFAPPLSDTPDKIVRRGPRRSGPGLTH